MTPLKSYKTSLRYPGGKSRAVNKMFKYLPDMKSYSEYREGFLGGGSVAIAITKLYPHLDIWVNDLYEPLYNFYMKIQSDGYKISDDLKEIKREHTDPEKARELFNKAKTQVTDKNLSKSDRAIAFYIANKCSFSGLTESGSFSKESSIRNFTLNGIENLRHLRDLSQNWKITNLSYEIMFEHPHKQCFIYLDPPYDIKDNLYGKNGSMHKGFDHNLFAERCNDSEMDIMVSYNADNIVKERFSDNWEPVEFDLTYTMRSTGEYMAAQKGRKELLLLNYKPEQEGLEGFLE